MERVKKKREYNAWVADETLEDYSLRYSPKSFRQWSPGVIASTALGGISFLALEAIGASLVISFGFSNSFWAILVGSIIILLTSIPISYYAARYNIDMDLLTRGAGFGYLGSTITSLIYASFTFIFFALEAAIMAQALELFFGLPLEAGYLVCSLVILPIVFYGVTLINKLQAWTQVPWIVLMLLPYFAVYHKSPETLTAWIQFGGESSSGAGFNPILFGFAISVVFSLSAQIGEQVDYLRFLPDKTRKNRVKWWLALLGAGPGWIIIGGLKMLGGAFLATLAIRSGLSYAEASEPVMIYLEGYKYLFSSPEIALAVVTIFVIISQVKINVTNAYAGSLAWSNFFSRAFHTHPGRVVWLVFNVLIALMLMQLGVFGILEVVLTLYSNVAIAWVGALVGDLVINKPLGISPSYIEFKRAHLYNINPVGFGATLIASIVAILSYAGVFGEFFRAFSGFIALGLSFLLAPFIAWITKGKYYIAREKKEEPCKDGKCECGVCEHHYEQPDIAYCPFYEGNICSLCCSLEASCNDVCKSDSAAWKKEKTWYRKLLLGKTSKLKKNSSISRKLPLTAEHLKRFLSVFVFLLLILSALFAMIRHRRNQMLEEGIEWHTIIDFLDRQELFAFVIFALILSAWIVVISMEWKRVNGELEKINRELKNEINDRLATEERLKESETRFKALHDASFGGIMIHDRGKMIDCNQGLSEMSGYTYKELMEYGIKKLISPEYWEEVDKRIKEGNQEAYDVIALRNNGEKFNMKIETRIIPYYGKKVRVAQMRDITDQKVQEFRDEQLGILKEDLLLPNPLDRKIAMVTDHLVEVLEADFARIWLIKPGDICQTKCIFGPLSKNPVCEGNTPCLHLISSSGRYTHIDGGHSRVPLGAFKIGKLAVDEGNGFISNDICNDKRLNNRKWAERLGLVSFAGYRLISQEQNAVGVLALFSKKVFNRKDEIYIHNLGTSCSTVVAQAAANDALIESERNLTRLNDSKNKFFSIIGHDLKSPFNAILGFTDILIEEFKNISSEEMYGMIKQIDYSAKGAYNLLENLLLWAKSESGGMPFLPQSVILDELVRNEVDLCKPVALKKNILLINDVKKEIRLMVDDNMLRTILRNLISNALKFTPEGGKVMVSAEVLSEKDTCQITVADTGIGMKEMQLTNLFKLSNSVSTSGTNNEKGTGLGLILSKDFVDRHKGEIEVESQQGEGTTFRVLLPLNQKENETKDKMA